MALKRKLLRLLSFICGALLIAISPFFIFHTEKIYYSFPSPPGYFWGYSTYYVLFGVFLFIAGPVLIVASYYHHEEIHLAVKNESTTI